MITPFGHLSYCTNIHPGEEWDDHFNALRVNVPLIKKKLSPNKLFGIGLRLSHVASLELTKEERLNEFQRWLEQEDCYVFSMNGFPYGSFHRTQVKDQVHAPDWTTHERLSYTIRMFNILNVLLPELLDGGISTSPLSYKHWYPGPEDKMKAFEKGTRNIIKVIEHLFRINLASGKMLHLDIEPEPDGLIESGSQFLTWYNLYLIPHGVPYLKERFNVNEEEAESIIRNHLRLCYDVCHFAIGFEDHAKVISELKKQGIKTGKIQISAALKANLSEDIEQRAPVIEAFKRFNESTYLHQVIARQKKGDLKRYRDLPEALADAGNKMVAEWRSHFHVPLFIHDYGVLQSTQDDISTVLAIHKAHSFTNHLEIETYTWEVLPDDLKVPLHESIIRELEWVENDLQIVHE